jgi:hypothetical protein
MVDRRGAVWLVEPGGAPGAVDRQVVGGEMLIILVT